MHGVSMEAPARRQATLHTPATKQRGHPTPDARRSDVCTGHTLPRRGRALARGSGSVVTPGCAALQPTRAARARDGQVHAHGTHQKRCGVVRDALTLRQTCPQPRPRAQFAFKDSMIHGQCRSHYVSHFAAFFIVARAKISVVESCLSFNRRCR